MRKHIPGPWSIDGPVVRDIKDHAPTAFVLINDEDTDENHDRRAYALVKGFNARSNARLIAAAPDLLEACKEARDRLPGCMLWSKLNAAIEKATGVE